MRYSLWTVVVENW